MVLYKDKMGFCFFSSNQKKTTIFKKNYGDEGNGYRIIFALKKTVLFRYTGAWKTLSPNMNFGADWGYCNKSMITRSGTRAFPLATLLWQKSIFCKKRKVPRLNPFNIHIEKHMSLFLFLSRYVSEDFSILPFVAIYIHIIKLVWCGHHKTFFCIMELLLK